MRHNQVIYLIDITITKDEIGQEIENKTERKVFANEFSVSNNEFYNAQVSGLKPEKKFEIYSFEYQNETKLKHDNKEYNIIRTEKKGEKIRITCERVVAND